MQDEEEQTSSKASKAAQKRARKKAAAKQAAGAAVAASTESASQQQPQHLSAETEVCTAEPDTSITMADSKHPRVDMAGAVAQSSSAAAPGVQQSADDDWMLCPLSGVSQACVACYLLQLTGWSPLAAGQSAYCNAHTGGHGRPSHVQQWPHIQPCRHHSMVGREWRCVATDQPATSSH